MNDSPYLVCRSREVGRFASSSALQLRDLGSTNVLDMHLTPPEIELNERQWMSKIIREPLLRWKANFLKKETA